LQLARLSVLTTLHLEKKRHLCFSYISENCAAIFVIFDMHHRNRSRNTHTHT